MLIQFGSSWNLLFLNEVNNNSQMECKCPYLLIQTIAEKMSFYDRKSCHEGLEACCCYWSK